MTYRDYTPEQVGERGEAIYDERIRPLVEAEHRGEYIVIDIETGEWLMGRDPDTLAGKLHAERFEAPLYSIRIGHRSTAFIGASAMDMGQ